MRHLWLLVLLLTASSGHGEERAFPWAAEARAIAPEGWVGGQVIGHDPAARTGLIAVYPQGDENPRSPGMALSFKLDGDGHPIRSTAVLRDKRPTEHIFFQTNPSPHPDDAFVPQPNLPAGTTACASGAWTNDPDPKGLNLRAAPSAKARIVATLPHLKSPYGIEFRIIGVKDGWFLIENAENPDYEQTAPKTQRIYAGRGWVAGALIGSGIAGHALLSSPHDVAASLLTLSGTVDGMNYGPDGVTLKRILGCNEGWTRVEVEDPPTRTLHTGWVDRLCSNQVTTCP